MFAIVILRECENIVQQDRVSKVRVIKLAPGYKNKKNKKYSLSQTHTHSLTHFIYTFY
jgi:hypothetical protein